MTQLAKPSGAEDGVSSPGGCPAKNFDTQRIPSLQPLVDEPGAAAVVGARAGRPGVQVATRSTKSPKKRLIADFVARPDLPDRSKHANMSSLSAAAWPMQTHITRTPGGGR